MKRLIPTSLVDFLAANRNCIKADCFIIPLPVSLAAQMGPGGGGSNPIVSVVLKTITAHTNDVGYPSAFHARIAHTPYPGGSPPATQFLYSAPNWTTRTDAFTLSGGGFSLPNPFTASDIAALNVWLTNMATLDFTCPPCTFQIYDCWLETTLADGTVVTWRPTVATINDNVLAYGDVTDPGNAIDGDPTTCATITRIRSNSLIDWNINGLVLSGFQVVSSSGGSGGGGGGGGTGGNGPNQTLYATEGQWDITIPEGTPGWTGPQTTFKSTKFGVWNRGKITSEADYQCTSNSMELTCIPQQGTNYPGLELGILNATLNHLFDGCTVWVYTVYMPIDGYGDVSAGVETKYQGTVTKVTSLGRNKVVFDVADPLFLLNMKIPSRLMQANCNWSFCDTNCNLQQPAFTVPFTADTPSTQSVLVPVGGFTQPDGYFTQGVVTCITGLNAGLSQTVKVHASGALQLMVPWILPVAAGDTFSALKGCDKTLTMCKTTAQADGTVVDNTPFFGGTPFVPAPVTSV